MPSDTKTTLTDIAQRVGVSPSTVSLTLRNKPGVSQETRQRVIQGALALGYTIKSIDGMPPPRVNTVGVLAKSHDDMTSQFYGPLLSGMETVCRKRHVNLLYAHLEVNEENIPVNMPRMLADNTADGLLITGLWLDEAIYGVLRHMAVPLVLVDSYAHIDDEHDAVLSDNQAGTYKATMHLIERGHRHIALVGTNPNSYPSLMGRRRGYQSALSEAGLPAYFADSLPRPEYIEPVLVAILAESPQLTAIVGCNDLVAIHSMQLLHKLGKRVPEDYSVIGYDDINLAEHVRPALTTMRVDKQRMGRSAVDILLDRLDNPMSATLRTVILPELIERGSVSAPRSDTVSRVGPTTIHV